MADYLTTNPISLNIRLRNKDDKLLDVKFPIDIQKETVTKLAKELAEDGIISETETKDVSRAMAICIVSRKSFLFRRCNTQVVNNVYDKDNLFGFGRINIVEE